MTKKLNIINQNHDISYFYITLSKFCFYCKLFT